MKNADGRHPQHWGYSASSVWVGKAFDDHDSGSRFMPICADWRDIKIPPGFHFIRTSVFSEEGHIVVPNGQVSLVPRLASASQTHLFLGSSFCRSTSCSKLSSLGDTNKAVFPLMSFFSSGILHCTQLPCLFSLVPSVTVSRSSFVSHELDSFEKYWSKYSVDCSSPWVCQMFFS